MHDAASSFIVIKLKEMLSSGRLFLPFYDVAT